ncbi:MAG: hypothetical protein E6K59_08050, partial [Nitrospirae bacterium]
MRRLILKAAALLLLGGPGVLQAEILPQLPQSFLDTTYAEPTGTVRPVNAGGDLQDAINAAAPGDVIVLQAGATFTGPFTLPNKTGTGWIYIRSSAYANLPSPGTRVNPSQASLMPKIEVAANQGGAIQTASGAHHYRFIGIEFVPTGSPTYGLLQLGWGSEPNEAALPNNIVVDRCYIHGPAGQQAGRGVALNGKSMAVIDSYLSDFKDTFDAQAIAGWNGAGPFKIVNNYLEATGENILFGGADPTIVDLVPSDIEIRGNHLFKPTAWRTQLWTVKNLFELKNARRVLFEGNVLEHSWVSGQDGYAILLTVRNQDGGAPWSTIEDVTLRKNIIRHANAGLDILTADDPNVSQNMKRVLIEDNVFEDLSTTWGSLGRFIVYLGYAGASEDMTIEHNTAFYEENMLNADGIPHLRFIYRNNITPRPASTSGFIGTGQGEGTSTLNTYFPGYVFAKNVLAGATPAIYPKDNFFPPANADVDFVDLAGGDYHLAASSPYKNAGTDGKDIGADVDALNAATACAVSGACGTLPPPDTTPPTVSLSAPTSGATVSGSAVTVSADASDNISVVGVQFKLDGMNLGAELTTVPYSISWNTTTTSNGGHTLTAVARDAAGNVATSATVGVTVSNVAPGTRTPYNGTPAPVPGVIEAENFDRGGEGVAYHDNVAGNAGGLYRTAEDVDIIASCDPVRGGYVVNNFETGEWMEYTINVIQTGTYRIAARVSSEFTSTAYHVEIDRMNVTGSVMVPNTGGWCIFQDVGVGGVSLSAGPHVLRIQSDVQYFNINSIAITAVTDTTPPTVSLVAPPNGATVSGAGVTVSATASDNVGVVGVQFQLDGVNLGAEVTASPYAISWNSTTASNATHTLSAVARDAAGNTATSAAVSVTISNAAPPPSSTKFSLNDRVQVINGTLNVRSTPTTAGTLLGSQSIGALGTVIGGPVNADGFNWWNINYDTGVDGWSVEDNLVKYVAPPPPAPTLSFSASPTSITSGQSSTLSWSSTNATSCTASNGWTGTKAISGTQAVTPTATTTYTLACTGSGGTATQSTTVTVSSVTPPPPSTTGQETICSDPNVFFCDNFENRATGFDDLLTSKGSKTPAWSMSGSPTSPNGVAVSTGQAFDGTKSMAFNMPVCSWTDNQFSGCGAGYGSVPVGKSDFYMRHYVMWPSGYQWSPIADKHIAFLNTNA